MRRIDLTGRRFDKLVCIVDVGMDRHGSRLWLCLCDCGNNVTKRAGVLTSDNQRQMACNRCGDEAKQRNRIKHGGAKTPLYRSWMNMRVRCARTDKPRYRYWAGKGIKVCEAWQRYATFRAWALSNGYKQGLSIDRIDPSGHYEPGNCRWVTVSENTVFSLERRYKKNSP